MIAALALAMTLVLPANSMSEIWRDARTSTPVVKESDRGIHLGYQNRPVDWLVEQLGIPRHTIVWSENPGYKKHRWDGTREPLVAALDGLAAWKSVGVEAGTGTQKTYVLGAGAMLWFLACFEDALVVTLAPKEDQLKLHLWKEARRLFPRFKLKFPNAQLTDLKLRMRGGLDESWTATGFVAGVGADEETAGKARGFHAKHALYIFEERPAVHEAIQSAIDFTCTAPHNLQLQLGNPDNEQDGLHQFCVREDIVHVRISALDHPNVVTGNADLVPGAASRVSVGRVRGLYGEGSDQFNAKVRGIAPRQSADALIRWEWCEAAAARYSDPAFRQGLAALGVDVADSPTGDDYAIARGIGACVLEIESQRVGMPGGVKNAADLGDKVGLEIAVEEIDESHVGVDSVGVGASTVNKLTELRYLVRALNGGAAPTPRIDEDVLVEKGRTFVPAEIFVDLRSQMYWQLRQDLMHNRIALPNDPELFRDLTAVKWEKRSGKIVVEPKDASARSKVKNWGVRARLGRSTNKGDAVVYWNYVRHRRPIAQDEAAPSAWDKDVLAHEAKEGRRVRTKKVKKSTLPVTAVESVD